MDLGATPRGSLVLLLLLAQESLLASLVDHMGCRVQKSLSHEKQRTLLAVLSVPGIFF